MRGHANAASGDIFSGMRGGGGGPSGVAKNIGDVLDAPRRAIQEAIFHKGSSDADREARRSAIGIQRGYDDPRLFGMGPGSSGIPVPDWVTHLGRGLTDTALDIDTDPLSAVGGLFGTALKGGAALLGRGAQALEKAPFVG